MLVGVTCMEYEKSHTGDDSNTLGPKSSTLGQDAKNLF